MDPVTCIPVLPSLDIGQTESFFVQHLKFEAERHGDAYLLVRRPPMELHFWLTDEARLPENTSCYIRGGQVEDLYAEFAASGVPGISAFEVMPWNMKEFHIRDPHGNLLRFGMAPEEVRNAG